MQFLDVANAISAQLGEASKAHVANTEKAICRKRMVLAIKSIVVQDSTFAGAGGVEGSFR